MNDIDDALRAMLRERAHDIRTPSEVPLHSGVPIRTARRHTRWAALAAAALIVLVVGVVLALRGSRTVPSPPAGHSTCTTSLPPQWSSQLGRVVAPNALLVLVTPDGRLLVHRDGRLELLDRTGAAHPLVTAAAVPVAAVDGHQVVALIRHDTDAHPHARADLFTADLDGGASHSTRLPGAAESLAVQDGHAYVALVGRGGTPIWDYTLRPDGSGVTRGERIARAGHLTWSPGFAVGTGDRSIRKQVPARLSRAFDSFGEADYAYSNGHYLFGTSHGLVTVDPDGTVGEPFRLPRPGQVRVDAFAAGYVFFHRSVGAAGDSSGRWVLDTSTGAVARLDLADDSGHVAAGGEVVALGTGAGVVRLDLGTLEHLTCR